MFIELYRKNDYGTLVYTHILSCSWDRPYVPELLLQILVLYGEMACAREPLDRVTGGGI